MMWFSNKIKQGFKQETSQTSVWRLVNYKLIRCNLLEQLLKNSSFYCEKALIFRMIFKKIYSRVTQTITRFFAPV